MKYNAECSQASSSHTGSWNGVVPLPLLLLWRL
jgi:hypothetical protein